MLDAPGYPKAYIETSGFRIELSNASLSENGVEGIFRITRREQA
jgi:methionyl-tRNA formyltransferase